jgi:hypothetical protein
VHSIAPFQEHVGYSVVVSNVNARRSKGIVLMEFVMQKRTQKTAQQIVVSKRILRTVLW